MKTAVIHIPDSFSWLTERMRACLPVRKDPEDVMRLRFRFTAEERRILRKRKKIPVNEWAERHRIVTRGPFENNRYRSETTPYLRGIMDASFFPSVQCIIVCSAPQIGKTFMVDTCIGYAVDRDPGPVLYVYPDEGTATENSKDRIQPMIRKSHRLRSYLTGAEDDEAAKRINLQHMQIYMAWASSAKKLANKTIKYLVFDEVDKYPVTASKQEAAPVALGEARAIWYKDLGMKIWKVSTPTVEAGPIWISLNTEAEAIFDYWVRCPRCMTYQLMEFETEKRAFRWPEDERDPEKIERYKLAWYECQGCGERWDDGTRNQAVRMGKWRARQDGNQSLFTYLKQMRPRKIGFHIPSWISRFVSLSEVAAGFLRGQKDKIALRDFNNKHAARPWVYYTQERKEDEILALRDDRPRGLVPSGNIISGLTAAVDTHPDGFYYEIRAWGWGLSSESWQIREGFVLSFDDLDQILIRDGYYDSEGRRYYVEMTFIDSGGGKTSEVYDWCRTNRNRYVPIKGERSMNNVRIFSKIDTYPGTNKRIPGSIQLLRLNTTHYKNLLSNKLEIKAADPGAWHLHSECTYSWAQELCAEFVNDKGFWERPEGRANEAWDLGVYNLAAMELRGLKQRVPVQEAPDQKTKETKSNWVPPRQGDWLKRR